MTATIYIGDLDKANILASLYNMAVLRGDDPVQYPDVFLMDHEIAERWLQHSRSPFHLYAWGYFDTIDCHNMKVGVDGDHLNPRWFDDDNGGEGAAETAINHLRKTGRIYGLK